MFRKFLIGLIGQIYTEGVRLCNKIVKYKIAMKLDLTYKFLVENYINAPLIVPDVVIQKSGY